MATQFDELAAARWQRVDHSKECKAMDVLHAALADPEVQQAAHIIVIYAKETDDDNAPSGWMQSGSYNGFAQIGLLSHTLSRFNGEHVL